MKIKELFVVHLQEFLYQKVNVKFYEVIKLMKTLL